MVDTDALSVWIKSGICTCDSLLNILLCCLGYVPGLIHAWYIIARNPERDPDYEPIGQDAEGGRVTYYYVAQGPPNARQQQGYGGTSNRQRMEVPHATKPTPPQQQNGTATATAHRGESSSGQTGPPPTYADAVQGDHKVQTQG